MKLLYSVCKQMVHVWCYGENIEGGKNKCALCLNPQGLSTHLLDRPPTSLWYTCPPQSEIMTTSSVVDTLSIDDDTNSQGWLTQKKYPYVENRYKSLGENLKVFPRCLQRKHLKVLHQIQV